MSLCAARVRFRGKANMTLCGNTLSQSQLGVKRTWLVAAHMSAFDPKRTLAPSRPAPASVLVLSRFDAFSSVSGVIDEAARIHHNSRWCGSMAARGGSRTAKRPIAANRIADDDRRKRA